MDNQRAAISKGAAPAGPPNTAQAICSDIIKEVAIPAIEAAADTLGQRCRIRPIIAKTKNGKRGISQACANRFCIFISSTSPFQDIEITQID